MFSKGKHQDTAQRFTIKKFKFGAASVLIGTVFAVFAGGAQAQTSEVASSTEPSNTVSVSSEAPVATEVVAESAPVVSEPVASSAVAESTAAPVASSEAASTTAVESSEAPASEASAVKSEAPKAVATSEVASEAPKAVTSEAAKPAAAPVVEKTAPAATTAAVEAPVVRVTNAPYKVTYTDTADNTVVYRTNKAVTFSTTATEKATVEVTAKSEVGSAPALEGYKLAEGQAAVQSAYVVEKGSRNNVINFNVVKDDTVAAGGNNDEDVEGKTAMFAPATPEEVANNTRIGNLPKGDGVVTIQDPKNANQTFIFDTNKIFPVTITNAGQKAGKIGNVEYTAQPDVTYVFKDATTGQVLKLADGSSSDKPTPQAQVEGEDPRITALRPFKTVANIPSLVEGQKIKIVATNAQGKQIESNEYTVKANYEGGDTKRSFESFIASEYLYATDNSLPIRFKDTFTDFADVYAGATSSDLNDSTAAYKLDGPNAQVTVEFPQDWDKNNQIDYHVVARDASGYFWQVLTGLHFVDNVKPNLEISNTNTNLAAGQTPEKVVASKANATEDPKGLNQLAEYKEAYRDVEANEAIEPIYVETTATNGEINKVRFRTNGVIDTLPEGLTARLVTRTIDGKEITDSTKNPLGQGRSLYVIEGTPTKPGVYRIEALAVDQKDDEELSTLYTQSGRPAKNNYGVVNTTEKPFSVLVRNVQASVDDVVAGADVVPVTVSANTESFDVIYPNSNGTPAVVTYTKDDKGVFRTPDGAEVPVVDGKLQTPTPAGVNLPEGQHVTVTAYNKFDYPSEPAQNNITNEAPVVTPPADRTVEQGTPIKLDDLIKEAKATDKEDDADGKDETKPTIAITDNGGLDTSKPGTYTLTFVATDSQGKVSEPKTMTITVTADKTAPAAPVVDDVWAGADTVPVTPPTDPDTAGLEVTYPNSNGQPVTVYYTKGKDGHYYTQDGTQLPVIDGKLQTPTPAGVNLPEGQKVTARSYDNNNNVSEPAQNNITNEAPVVTPPADKTVPQGTEITDKQLISEASAADKEDDNDNKESTKPTIKITDKGGLDTSKPGTYKVTFVAVDSQGKESQPKTMTIVVERPDKDKYTPSTSEIVVPQGTPVTPKDVSDHVNIPDGSGGKIKEIGEIPSTDTPGDKTPVKVVMEYPDGSTDTVEVPIKVTPVPQPKPTPDKDKYTPSTSEIVVPQGTPVTPKDVSDHVNIPDGSGGKIKEIGEIPSTDTPGDKTPVKVVMEYPDGSTDTVEVPIKVTPVPQPKPTPDKDKYTPSTSEIVVPQGTPVTPKDVSDHVNIPDGSGGKIKEIGEIPSTDTPGDKTPVKVVMEYPDGSTDTVEVPIKVTPVPQPKPTPDKDKYTPSTSEIVVPQGTPVTPKDVSDHVNIPDGSGGKIKEIGEIPSTDTPGDKTPVKVVMEYPDGSTDTVEVPIKVTPVPQPKPTPDKDKYTPSTSEIVVPQGTPVTPKDVSDHVNIPDGSGGKIKEIGEIPSTDTPGDKTPVKVVMEYPDGSTDTVEVPIKVTPVPQPKPTPDKDKYTPSTSEIVVPQGTPVTPKDVSDHVNIPDGSGGKIKEIGEIPSTDTPGDKTPVKVVMEYPDGSTDTVEVPIKVTPVPQPKPTPDKDKYTPSTSEIVVPQGTPVTPKDVSDHVNIPDGSGGKIKEIGEIPSTDTPGDKTPVKVVMEYPDGSTDTVEVPIKVTPVPQPKPTPDKDKYTPSTSEIVVPQGTPVTPKDVSDHVNIPDGSGGKIKEIGEIPSTDTPGDKTPVKVVMEYPDGSTDTVEVPIKVTPVPQPKPTPDKDKYTPSTSEIVVPQGTPVTPKDVSDHVNIPDGSGGKIKEIGEIPSTDTPGDKTPVKVVMEYPDGSTDTVEVPIKVTPVPQPKPTPDKDKYTPSTSEIVVPQGTPVTPKDVSDHVNIPDGSGGKIKEIGEIPSTDTPGDKTPVKVVMEYPDGSTDTVEVPIKVTPVPQPKPTPDKDKYTPSTSEIVVPQGTPVTPKDVSDHVNIPDGSGGKIKEIGEIPSTDTPGDKTPVKVVMEYPDGSTDTVEVPIKVTPVPQPKPTPDKDKYTPSTSEIVVPQGTPVTPKDVSDHVNIPDGSGGKIKEIGEIPSTDTPGDKTPVKVVMEYPDGSTDTVEVPIKVTPVPQPKPTPDKDKYTPSTSEIVVPQGTPVTPKDVSDHVNIPDGSGGKIKEIGEIPSTDTPGDKTPVKVVMEYPDGSTDTVEVPIKVTPVPQPKPTPDKDKYTPSTSEIVVPQGTPVTPKDVSDHVNIPDGSGGKIKEIGEIPSTDTPGDKTPVKVVMEYPDGSTDTVEVPIKVTPVPQPKPTPDKDKYTPSTSEIVVPQGTPVTPKDVSDHVNIPDGSGGKIKEIGEIPSTDTPGDKTPVKVVMEYPDGSTDTVEVPIKVTPVPQPKPTPDKDKYTPSTSEIVVPQGTPVTPKDVSDHVNIPDGSGGKIKEIGEIPSTDTPGDKTPVKVVMEYPDGSTDTVEVPIKVTPVPQPKPTPDKDKYTPSTSEIVVPQGTPVTPKDVSDHVNIPDGSGGKIKEIGEIPSTDTPGDKTPVKVVMEYPDGSTDTVEVPIKVTPVPQPKPTPDKDKYTPSTSEIVVPQGTPVTPKDVSDHVNIPDGSGGKIKEIGEIPSTDTPGDKTPVKVVMEYPDGSTDTVEVPIKVTPVPQPKPTPDKDKYTPSTSEIVVPQGTPVTPKDVSDHVNIPDGSGGKIKEIGEIPSTDTPGDKTPVKVVMEYPDGSTDTVEVPIKVTPVPQPKPTPDKDKYTPSTSEIVVPQGTPVTPKDVSDHVNIPDGSGGKIKEIGEIPSTDTPGDKTPVKVVMEYPDGSTDTVEVPIKVTPVPQPKPTPDKDKYTPSTSEIVVPQGTPVTPKDVSDHVNIPDGSTDTVEVPIKVTPVPQPKPTPDKDKYTPSKSADKPSMPSSVKTTEKSSNQMKVVTKKPDQAQSFAKESKMTSLLNTGTASDVVATTTGISMILASLGLASKRRRKED